MPSPTRHKDSASKTPEPLLELTMKLALASPVTAAHPDDLEELNDALGNAEVMVQSKAGAIKQMAERFGEDQDGTYRVKLPAGNRDG